MSYRRDGDNNRGFQNFGPKPVEVGKEYELEITEMSQKGDGVTRVQGFVVFVKGGQKGQKVKVKITSVGPRFAIGQTV